MPLSFAELTQRLTEKFPEALLAQQADVLQPFWQIRPQWLVPVCAWLRDAPDLYFDHLACLSGVDLGATANQMQVVYHLTSVTQGHMLVLKVQVARPAAPPQTDADMPRVPSVCSIWRAAEWHEREAYDLLGIYFTDHPDLRRMLLPADWVGHPLRKDYEEPEAYHNIDIAY